MGTALSDFLAKSAFYKANLCRFGLFMQHLATASAAISATHIVVITAAAAY